MAIFVKPTTISIVVVIFLVGVIVVGVTTWFTSDSDVILQLIQHGVRGFTDPSIAIEREMGKGLLHASSQVLHGPGGSSFAVSRPLTSTLELPESTRAAIINVGSNKDPPISKNPSTIVIAVEPILTTAAMIPRHRNTFIITCAIASHPARLQTINTYHRDGVASSLGSAPEERQIGVKKGAAVPLKFKWTHVGVRHNLIVPVLPLDALLRAIPADVNISWLKTDMQSYDFQAIVSGGSILRRVPQITSEVYFNGASPYVGDAAHNDLTLDWMPYMSKLGYNLKNKHKLMAKVNPGNITRHVGVDEGDAYWDRMEGPWDNSPPRMNTSVATSSVTWDDNVLGVVISIGQAELPSLPHDPNVQRLVVDPVLASATKVGQLSRTRSIACGIGGPPSRFQSMHINGQLLFVPILTLDILLDAIPRTIEILSLAADLQTFDVHAISSIGSSLRRLKKVIVQVAVDGIRSQKTVHNDLALDWLPYMTKMGYQLENEESFRDILQKGSGSSNTNSAPRKAIWVRTA